MSDLCICADDFAQNESISEGILNLASKKRINATSCMVNSLFWQEMAFDLKNIPDTLK